MSRCIGSVGTWELNMCKGRKEAYNTSGWPPVDPTKQGDKTLLTKQESSHLLNKMIFTSHICSTPPPHRPRQDHPCGSAIRSPGHGWMGQRQRFHATAMRWRLRSRNHRVFHPSVAGSLELHMYPAWSRSCKRVVECLHSRGNIGGAHFRRLDRDMHLPYLCICLRNLLINGCMNLFLRGETKNCSAKTNEKHVAEHLFSSSSRAQKNEAHIYMAETCLACSYSEGDGDVKSPIFVLLEVTNEAVDGNQSPSKIRHGPFPHGMAVSLDRSSSQDVKESRYMLSC